MTILQKKFLLGLKLIFISFSILWFNACEQVPFIEANNKSGLKETRLGESKYYLLLPENFKLSEARGKEGQLGYSLIPIDTSSTMFGFIEIRHGNPIGGDSLFSNKNDKIFAESYLLNKKVSWTINQSETGYFTAFTTENGDLNARVSSKNRNEIESLISVIATLKEK